MPPTIFRTRLQKQEEVANASATNGNWLLMLGATGKKKKIQLIIRFIYASVHRMYLNDHRLFLFDSNGITKRRISSLHSLTLNTNILRQHCEFSQHKKRAKIRWFLIAFRRFGVAQWQALLSFRFKFWHEPMDLGFMIADFHFRTTVTRPQNNSP